MLKLYVQVETVTLQLFQIPPRRHASEHLVNIMSVKSILVHCNIIHSAYMRGTQVPLAYNYFPDAASGQKILEAPYILIYLPVTPDVISTLSVWLTDQHGKF